MTDQGLTDIFDKIMAGVSVEDWGGAKYGDELDVLRQGQPDRMWVRRTNGKWVEVPGMGSGANADRT